MSKRETLSRPAAIVLALAAAGQALRSAEFYKRAEASIGAEAIPFGIVAELERGRLIRCRHVHHKGPLHGKFCDYELTDRGRQAAAGDSTS